MPNFFQKKAYFKISCLEVSFFKISNFTVVICFKFDFVSVLYKKWFGLQSQQLLSIKILVNLLRLDDFVD